MAKYLPPVRSCRSRHDRDTAALNVFYFALALIVMGVGYLKPNISTIVGKLYRNDDPRRDVGFTIFYMGINIGSFAATLLCGWLGETYGWRYGFGAAGIGMIIGLITFLYGQKYLLGHAEPSEPERLKKSFLGPINIEWSIYLLSLPFLGVFWLLVQHEPVVLLTQNVFLIIAIVGLILYSMVHSKEGSNTVAYVIAGCAVVCGLYAVGVNLHFIPGSEALAENVLYLSILLIVGFVVYGFVTHNSPEFGAHSCTDDSDSVDGGLLGAVRTVCRFDDFVCGSRCRPFDWLHTFTAAQFGSLNAGFIMLLAIPFAALWTWLSKRILSPTHR